eukprot:TRINITY_DN22545_c0_g1_i1.p1 TRINITY_DN22545_c0_g1~~TRINITY_DN22545_c0_g1_i1.p1  ORF type:complete len:458 (+),score=52.59 TRINITY_DN22545_c0_g1_i1:68-1441(+)
MIFASVFASGSLVIVFAVAASSSCTSFGSLDLRVTKALGPHGYESARISVITSGEPLKDARLTYKAPFRYRWTDFALSTGLVTGLHAGVNEVRIGNATACVKLPALGSGVRGVIFGDPCTGKGAMKCREQASSTWDVEDRLSTLLNRAAAGPHSIDFWASVGDNFYDKQPIATKSFFDRLEPAVKSTFLMTVPGNGDFWPGSGTPDMVTCDMPFGYGFLQWYGQDSLAGKLDPAEPFDFSIVPPNATADLCKQDTGFCAAPANFFSYHILGNIGFIGYSGHTSFKNQEASFEEACEYFQAHSSHVQEVVLFGHWSGQDHGCPVNGGADTGTLQRTLRERFASTPCSRAKAFFGHMHCNTKESFDCGPLAGTSCFQIGAAGAPSTNSMPHGACDAHWGVLYLDTTNGTQLTYFQLGNEDSDLSQPLLHCLQAEGFAGCSHHGVPWISVAEENEPIQTV